MSSTFAASLARRQVYLTVKPLPRSVRESREILKAIQRFGEVLTFKSLRYDKAVHAPGGIRAIFQDTKGAKNALEASPLRVQIDRPKTTPSQSLDDPANSPPSDGTADNDLPYTMYKVDITPSYVDHTISVQYNGYNGHWYVRPNSVPYTDMERTVPIYEHADCSPSKEDSTLRDMHDLRKEVMSQEGLMDLWRRGMEDNQ